MNHLDQLRNNIRSQNVNKPGYINISILWHDGNLYNYEARRLGSGGSKTAWEFTPEYVIMLPNIDTSGYLGYWPLMVENEVKMSNYLREYNLLTTNNFKVHVEVNGQYVPAYVSDNFEYLARNGYYAIDRKNSSSSLWKGKTFVGDDIFNVDKWYSAVEWLIDDYEMLVRLGLDGYIEGADSSNFIVFERENKIRYYGFDFASKQDRPEDDLIPRMQEDRDNCKIPSIVSRRIRSAVSTLLGYERNWSYDIDPNGIQEKELLEGIQEKVRTELKIKYPFHIR